ncbi:hypothetical protein CRE_20919 [Caenorhabditis remanei]|uniref:Retrotransposon gag domain-containing protein n=1 Tax=Caenorhabditis remanei TaxID=31234 RepID=E3N914_CAERE|nr:hypothetical protein CRE_20919 [Caenorhabditis remanei]
MHGIDLMGESFILFLEFKDSSLAGNQKKCNIEVPSDKINQALPKLEVVEGERTEEEITGFKSLLDTDVRSSESRSVPSSRIESVHGKVVHSVVIEPLAVGDVSEVVIHAKKSYDLIANERACDGCPGAMAFQKDSSAKHDQHYWRCLDCRRSKAVMKKSISVHQILYLAADFIENPTEEFADSFQIDKNTVIWSILKVCNHPKKVIWWLMPGENRSNATWNKLVESLTQAFEVPGDRELAQQELATVKHGTLSINEFARKLRTIGDYAYESVSANVRESLLVNHFIHHTNRYIRNKLLQMDSTPKTLEVIIRKAERFQRLQELEDDQDGEELIAAMSDLILSKEDRGREQEPRPPVRAPPAPRKDLF